MANVSFFFGSWVSAGPGNDMPPGSTHSWVMWGFNYGDSVNVTAQPVQSLNQGGPEYILAVENVRMQTDPGGRRLFFTVRNVGPNAVDGYGMGFGMIRA
jgi:hypothetical protein